jgi:hypothetical protein
MRRSGFFMKKKPLDELTDLAQQRGSFPITRGNEPFCWLLFGECLDFKKRSALGTAVQRGEKA